MACAIFSNLQEEDAELQQGRLPTWEWRVPAAFGRTSRGRLRGTAEGKRVISLRVSWDTREEG